MGHAKPVVPRPRRLRLESRPLQALAGTHDAYDTMTVDELTVTVQTDRGPVALSKLVLGAMALKTESVNTADVLFVSVCGPSEDKATDPPPDQTLPDPSDTFEDELRELPDSDSHPTIGGYVVLSPLGRQRDHELHLSYDVLTTGHPRPCVVKRFIDSGQAHVDVERARFLEEARIGRLVRHPNIVDIFDYGEHGGTPFLVRELVDGMNLRGLRALLSPRVPVRTVATIGYQLVDALDYAHAAGDGQGR